MSHQQPIVRLIASDALARNQGELALPQLLDLLQDPYAVNRIFGLFAVEKVLNRKLSAAEYDPLAPHDQRDEMVKRLQNTLPKAAVE